MAAVQQRSAGGPAAREAHKRQACQRGDGGVHDGGGCNGGSPAQQRWRASRARQRKSGRHASAGTVQVSVSRSAAAVARSTAEKRAPARARCLDVGRHVRARQRASRARKRGGTVGAAASLLTASFSPVVFTPKCGYATPFDPAPTPARCTKHQAPSGAAAAVPLSGPVVGKDRARCGKGRGRGVRPWHAVCGRVFFCHIFCRSQLLRQPSCAVRALRHSQPLRLSQKPLGKKGARKKARAQPVSRKPLQQKRRPCAALWA